MIKIKIFGNVELKDDKEELKVKKNHKPGKDYCLEEFLLCKKCK